MSRAARALIVVLLGATLPWLAPSASVAATGDSSAYGVDVDVTPTGQPRVDFGPMAPVSSTGPTSATLASFTSAVLTTGAITTSATSSSGGTVSEASATIEDIAILIGPDLSNVQSLEVRCSSDPGGFTSSVKMTDSEGTLSDVSPISVSIPGTISIKINDRIAGPAGITVRGIVIDFGPAYGSGTMVLGSATCPADAVGGLDPRIEGLSQVGQTLTARPGPVFPADSSLSYQWNANGAPIAGATGQTLTLKKAQAGKAITVTITATSPGLTPQTETSDPTPTVREKVNRAQLSLDKSTVKRGGTVTLLGQGFTPYGTYTVRYNANVLGFGGTVVATVDADEYGELTAPITIPNGSPTGPVAISVTGANPAFVLTTVTVKP